MRGYPYAHLQPVMSFEDIAAELGVSKQRVYRLYKSAIRKLHAPMRRAQAMQQTLDRRREYAWRTNRNIQGAE